MRLTPVVILTVLVLGSIPTYLSATDLSTQPSELIRVLAPPLTPWNTHLYQILGCKTIIKLMESTVLACPPDAARQFTPEPIYHVSDMLADQQIGADDVWAEGFDGSGVTVAVLDTGVDTDHPDLVDSIVGGWNFIAGSALYEDDHGHGTHVAGIITSNGLVSSAKGVAPGAGIWAAKICDSSGKCPGGYLLAAIEDVVNNNRARVISMSLGGGGTTGPDCDYDVLAQKVNWAVSQGVTVIAAAGNSASYVSTPGCASGAIAVGAVDRYDRRASFSGTGNALDIMAPGLTIYSTYKGDAYAYMSGTSMATPHVSGAVALLLQARPDANNAELKEAIYTTAMDLYTAGWDKYYGWGRIDVAAALESLGTTPDTTPPEISNVAASGITSNSATITWATDEPADSQVEYGLDTTYGSVTPINPSLVTSHSIPLSILQASTTYHFRVKSTDAAGNPATSTDYTFTTPEPDTTPPIISNVNAVSIASTSATIIWTTDEPADSQVEYGTDTSYGSASPLNPALVTSHSVPLTSLQPSTTYHFRVKSTDAAGNPATSTDYTFTTQAVATNAMHVSSITMSVRSGYVTVKVTVVDASGRAVPYASVQAHWGGVATGSSVRTTNYYGQATFYVRVYSHGVVVFTVDNIGKSGWTYDAAANSETSDSITV